MSFDLGNWADKLTCDLCDDAEPLDLGLPADYLDSDFPDDFWDEFPEPPEEDFGFDLPDMYPTLGFTDGGFTFGVGGSF